jgi:hypothetical protein
VGNKLGDVVALWRGIFRVRTNVEVKPSAISQKDVAAASPRNNSSKKIPSDLVWT